MRDLREYWNFNDPSASRERFLAVLEEAEDASVRFEIQCQIARTYSLERQFTEAHALLDTLALNLPSVNGRAKAAYHLERGRTYNSAGEKPEAETEFLEASSTLEHDYRVDAYHMLAICTTDPAFSEAWNLKALELSGTSEDSRARRWRGSLLNNLGWTYHDSGRYEKALPLFEEAITVREAGADLEATNIARWCYARCLRSLGRLEEALKVQQSLAPGSGYVSEELGEILLALGQAEEAKPHFARAYDLLSKDVWLAADQPERLGRLKDLSV